MNKYGLKKKQCVCRISNFLMASTVKKKKKKAKLKKENLKKQTIKLTCKLTFITLNEHICLRRRRAETAIYHLTSPVSVSPNLSAVMNN